VAEEDRTSNKNAPYQALYRRYRPQRFADVLGQEHVTRALRNAVQEGKVAHAYLFSGPRGTGKTSTARILAMALNCEAPVAGEPDGTCASCVSIRSGSSMDVFELDAASNRKLDEMRDLLSRVALGSPGRWKVYIVDEVHQLTPDAASALLKTLEEPPRHVVFVLATTDPQKVLPTVLSRTQHFEFRLLSGDLLTELLDGINQDAGLDLSPEAVSLAVRRGRGSARDAESALEQLAAAGGGEDDAGSLAELVEALAERDTGRALQAVATGTAAGKDPRRLGNDLLEYLRNAFLAVQAPSLVLLPGMTVDKLAESARHLTLPTLVRAMETVGQALVDMRDSVDPRVTLEVALVRLASPAVDTSPAALLERIERLERAAGEKGGAPPARPGEGAPGRIAGGPPSPPPAQAQPAPTHSAAAPLPPSQSAQGTTQPRVALGAVLAGAGRAPTAPSTDQAQTTGPDVPEAEEAQVFDDSRSSDEPKALGSPKASGAPGIPHTPAPALPVSVKVPAVEVGGLQWPSRDELTKAWGDAVLEKLSQPAKLFLSNGRFIEAGAGGGAVFALPAGGLLERARAHQREAESALAAYFGRPVPLRLVPDKGAIAHAGPTATLPARDESCDFDDLVGATEAPPVPDVPVEERILQAFPGSVLDR
jgi:DNA polymerase III subunit gamma/tau